MGSVGDRFWGHPEDSRGESGAFRRRAQDGEKPANLHGKLATWLFSAMASCSSILHGKEGVDGSIPSEGLHEMPANGISCRLDVQHAGTSRVHLCYWRGTATSRD
jgi:hypothetical protein